VLDTGAATRRNAWQRRFTAHVGLVEALARRYRVHLLKLRTDEPVGPALSRGLHPRRTVGAMG
jgi:hypothetical protein